MGLDCVNEILKPLNEDGNLQVAMYSYVLYACTNFIEVYTLFRGTHFSPLNIATSYNNYIT